MVCIQNNSTVVCKILFSGRYSPYSNFYSVPKLFSDDVSANVYCSSEQYFQYAKAKYFGLHGTAMEILAETDPAIIKQLGNFLSSSDKDSWINEAPRIMEAALTLKFSQNPDLRDLMTESGTKCHVECNQHDTYWGIGLARHNPDADKSDLWKGENMLGQLLDKVRDELTQ